LKNFDIFNDENEISKNRLTSKQKTKPRYSPPPPPSIASTTSETTADTHTSMSSEIGDSWLSKLTSADKPSEFRTRLASNQTSTPSDSSFKVKYADLSVEDKTKIINKLMGEYPADEFSQKVIDKYWQQLLDTPSYGKLAQTIK